MQLCPYARIFLLVYHGLLNEILQSVEAACFVAAVLSLNGVLQVLQVVHGLFGITEKLHRGEECEIRCDKCIFFLDLLEKSLQLTSK